MGQTITIGVAEPLERITVSITEGSETIAVQITEAARGPAGSGGSGSGELSDVETTGYTAGRYLRIAAAGGVEERTTANVKSDLAIASADITDAADDHSGSNYGKLMKSDAFGSFVGNRMAGNKLQVLGNGSFRGSFEVDLVDVQLGADRTYKAPNASGVVALTASTTGVPDNVILDEVTDATGSRTLALSDVGKYIQCTHGTATAVTVPQQSSVAWPAGAVIIFRRVGGAVTVSGIGVTINGGNGSTVAQHGTFAIRKTDATDVWDLI